MNHNLQNTKTQLTVKTYNTPSGNILYRTNTLISERQTLVFLHGVGVDGRSFIPQIKAFKGIYNLLIWDMPAHGKSRPFPITFSLPDIATWLHDILALEGISNPILVAHSMGGFIAQCFIQQYPGKTGGFISIDSAPLQRRYLKTAELWSLDHTEALYRIFPWKLLLSLSAMGNAKSKYGQHVMYKMLSMFTKDEFCKLAGHDFKQIAAAYRADLPYQIDCPCLLICGKNDRTGIVKMTNKKWEKQTGMPMKWINDAGHCANLDAPDEVNELIQSFAERIRKI